MATGNCPIYKHNCLTNGIERREKLIYPPHFQQLHGFLQRRNGVVPFTIFYCSPTQADAGLRDGRVLALIRFSRSNTVNPELDAMTIALPELGETTTVEMWLGSQPVQSGWVDGVQYADGGNALFLQMTMDEVAPNAWDSVTAAAYRRLFVAARARGYAHILRVWNYFPAIHQEFNHLERYQAFCMGRHAAFTEELTEFEAHLPAASAIGSQGTGLQIIALASREAGMQIENPRQTSAFQYPRQYGPCSPSFSRALLKPWDGQNVHLYLSGTASVVGHASQHADLLAQLDETLINLKALLAEASQRSPQPLHLALLRVYLRDEISDLQPLRARIAQAFGATVPLLFLRGDICRRELLIEIEGFAINTTAHQDQDIVL